MTHGPWTTFPTSSYPPGDSVSGLSLFPRRYLGNHSCFLFLRLIICLNSAGAQAKRTLPELKKPDLPCLRGAAIDPRLPFQWESQGAGCTKTAWYLFLPGGEAIKLCSRSATDRGPRITFQPYKQSRQPSASTAQFRT